MTAKDVAAALTGGGAVDSLSALCRRCLALVAADGASLTLTVGPHQEGAVADSSPPARLAREAAFGLGEGPGLEAIRQGEPVLAGDLAALSDRWPHYAGSIAEAGVGSVFSFPLRIGAATLGLLEFYRWRPSALEEGDLRQALAVAEAATQVLVSWQAGAPPGSLAARLESGAARRAVVHQATGVAAAQLGCSIEEALVRLRAAAYASDRHIADLAADLVAGRLRLEDA